MSGQMVILICVIVGIVAYCEGYRDALPRRKR